jgi:hypothetical protein
MSIVTDSRSPDHLAAVAAADLMLGDEDAVFAQLQRRLPPFELVDVSPSADEQTVLAIPSINFDPWVLDSHASELPALRSAACICCLRCAAHAPG